MIVYLHANEMGDAGGTYGRHRWSRPHEDIHQIIILGETSPGSLRSKVLRSFVGTPRTLEPSSIEMLLINAHGSPGRIHLGGQHHGDCDIHEHNVDALTSIFRPYFKPLDQGGEGVEVHSCQVGAGSLREACGAAGDELTDDIGDDRELGPRFLYALARGFNIRVRASADNQIPDYGGYFESSMLEATPGEDDDWHGHVRDESGSPLVYTPSGPGLVEHGMEWTRLRAVFIEPSHRDDPRRADEYRREEARRRVEMDSIGMPYW